MSVIIVIIVIVIVCVQISQAVKRSCLPVKKKIHITPAQQMLNRFEAMQKLANSASAVKQSSGTDSDVAVKQSASHTDSSSAKVPCATKPKLGERVAHKPVLVSIAVLN